MWERTSEPRVWRTKSTLKFLNEACESGETLAQVFRRWEHSDHTRWVSELDHLSWLIEQGSLTDRATVDEARAFLKAERRATRRPPRSTAWSNPHKPELISKGSNWRWRCRCGASSGGQWYRSIEEAEKRARKHSDEFLDTKHDS